MNLKKNTLISLLLFLSFVNYAQEVQWASEVLEVSSTFNLGVVTKQFESEQLLGKPSVLSSFGETPCAWAPNKNNEIDSITVKYAKPILINRVIINQNFNPCAISKVYVIDINKTYLKVYEEKEVDTTQKGRLLNIVFPLTNTSVYAIKVILNRRKNKTFTQIDAIGIANSDKDYEIKINSFFDIGEIENPENLGENINSAYQEICPVISPDGKTLYFTRSKHPENTGSPDKQDIWFAEMRDDITFSKAKNIGAPINDTSHNSAFSVNTQKRLLLNNIYFKNAPIQKGLSVSYYKNNQWSFPEKLNVEGYYNDNVYSEFFLSANDSILLMTNERINTYGGKDIYLSFKIKGKKFSKPMNLGGIINTAASETSPFLSKDGKLLFFSTGGHCGYGLNDIFVSRRLDDTWKKWSVPQNLGAWINTSEWDAYLSMPDAMDCIYFSSFKNSMGESDIFRIKLSKENRLRLFGVE